MLRPVTPPLLFCNFRTELDPTTKDSSNRSSSNHSIIFEICSRVSLADMSSKRTVGLSAAFALVTEVIVPRFTR